MIPIPTDLRHHINDHILVTEKGINIIETMSYTLCWEKWVSRTIVEVHPCPAIVMGSHPPQQMERGRRWRTQL